MIIDQLPTVSLPVQDTDEIAIERGQQTFKASVDDLNKVSKAGDTMTGELVVQDSAVSVQDTNYGRTDLPPSTQYKYIQFLDKARNILGAIRSVLTSTGRSGVFTYGTNGSVTNGLGLYVESDGTRVVSVSDTAPWFSALGLGDVATESTVPITKGGTGATTAAAAKTNLGITGLGVKSVSVANGASSSISVASSTHGFLVLAGANTNFSGIYIFYVTSAGAVTLKAIGTAPSGATVTGSTNTITIANGTTTYGYAGAFSF